MTPYNAKRYFNDDELKIIIDIFGEFIERIDNVEGWKNKRHPQNKLIRREYLEIYTKICHLQHTP